MFYYKDHSMLTTLPSPSAQTIRQSVPDQEDIIRRSLERSARYGVDPHLDGAPESTRLSDEQLRERINGQRIFYTLGERADRFPVPPAAGYGVLYGLADSEGYVLYVVGDSDPVGISSGVFASPVTVGRSVTSGHAIGLSLEERVPCSCPATGYPAQARKISNAGAPVFSLDGGRVLGAISLSGGSDMMHIHTLGLVRQAAETVTSQLRERERIRELAIRTSTCALVESDSRGIVTVDQTGRIVEVTARPASCWKLSPGCEGKSFEESVGESYNITDISRSEGVPGTRNPCPAQRDDAFRVPRPYPHEQRRTGGRFVHGHGKEGNDAHGGGDDRSARAFHLRVHPRGERESALGSAPCPHRGWKHGPSPCFPARRERARSCLSRRPSITTAPAGTGLLWRSTAGPFPKSFWRASCSAMRKARSRERRRAGGPASSSLRTRARCSSTKSGICLSTCRSSCCACSSREKSSAWAVCAPMPWTSASSPRPTRISKEAVAQHQFGRISVTGSAP